MPPKVVLPAGSPIEVLDKLLSGEAWLETLECFTHFDEITGKPIRFNVTHLREHLIQKNHKKVEVVLDAKGLACCLLERGFESHRIASLTSEQLNEPAIFCQFSDGSTLMVDGTHRYIKRAILGFQTIFGYMVDESIWKEFLLPVEEGLTKEQLMNTPSGR